MDIFDRASELEQKQTKMALNNHFKKIVKCLSSVKPTALNAMSKYQKHDKKPFKVVNIALIAKH